MYDVRFSRQLCLSMDCLTKGSTSLTRMAHGVAYQLFQLREGGYVVILRVEVDDTLGWS
jgi:hypothetical protein